jgi:hypothetical protein
MHVTRVALVPDRRDTDLSLVHVILRETSSVEHSLGCALGLGLGDVGGNPVDLVIGAEGGGREEATINRCKLASKNITKVNSTS